MASRRSTVLLNSILLIVAVMTTAANCPAQEPAQEPVKKTSRIESIAIDPKTCELTWVVSKGELKEGQYLPITGSEKTYRMILHEAKMVSGDATLGFEAGEAKYVHDGVWTFIRYLASSTVWFDKNTKEKSIPDQVGQELKTAQQ